MLGKFITIEGVEGCGKSTQIARLDEHLREMGFITLVTRDPGGTHIGDAIREVLLSPQNTEMRPVCELLLFAASRAQLMGQIIRPSVEMGSIVLSDRFSASTYAYQAVALELGEDAFDAADGIATGGEAPDLTVILDVPPTVGMRRQGRGAQHVGDRIERRGIEFHERVREGYVAYARRHADRVVVLDGSPSEDAVHQEVIAKVTPILPERT
ncbi:MAG: dTMP kinase [Armatimonadota bacterium]|jgi:dTMP kinase